MIASLLLLSALAAPADQLIREIAEHAELMPNLEILSDDIGPRLTGSNSLHSAQAWAMKTLRRYGAANVHTESYAFGLPWHRGVERARLINGSGLTLDVAQWGWTKGTKGAVRGEVVLVDTPTLAQFEALAPRLAGKVLLVKARPRPTEDERHDEKAYRARLTRAWRSVPFAAALIPSGLEGGLLEMAGGPGHLYDARTAFISKDHAAMLERLLARGTKPVVELELGGDFGPKPVSAENLVAEWPGAQSPDEVVILGAHLDSWDLGSGATDNGAGVVAFMEVLRAFQATGLRPRRTLRLVLFSGEEQALLGSKAYLLSHAAELDKIQAVLVLDAGAGRILGVADGQVDAWAEALQRALEPAGALGPIDVQYARANGSDQETFRGAGLPAFGFQQDPGDYWSHTHHTRLDDLGHVVAGDLLQATQVLAVLAWGLLEGPKLPRVAMDEPRR